MGNWCSIALSSTSCEGGRQVEDGPPVLDGDDAAGGEGLPVADAVDLVEDRHGRVARPQEVRVERVHVAVLDGAARRHERLPGHLPAEDALALLVRLGAAEDVDLDRLEVEQADEELQGRAHRPMFAGPPRHGRRGARPHGAPLPCGGVTTATTPRPAARWCSPTGFTWGVATAAHQIEGANVNNDWWAWEHDPDSGTLEPSGDACDSFHRWREDIAAGGGHGARRLPLLARVEPDRAGGGRVLDRRARALPAHVRGLPRPRDRPRGDVPPLHDARAGSPAAAAGRRPTRPTASPATSSRATAYLGDLVGWACTINEPNVVSVMGYFQGQYPPGVKEDFVRYGAVNEAMVRAHRLAVDALRAGPGDFPVGLTLSMAEITAERGRRGAARRGRGDARERLPAGHRGRRLRRGAVLHADALRPRGPGARTTRASR